MPIKQQLSSKLFYRVYIILVISIVLIGSLLQYIDNYNSSYNEQQQLVDRYRPLINLTLNSLYQIDQQNWHKEIKKLSNVTKLKLNLLKKSDFSTNKELFDELSKGAILDLYDEDDNLSLYKQIDNSPYVLEIDTITTNFSLPFNWIPFVFYLLIALVVFLLIQPFTKQLLKLKEAAKKIGNGEFSTRLVMPQNSTLYPIADAFDTMTKEIEKLVIRQRDLTNAVSHELRTPLARLKFAFAELEDHLVEKEWLDNISGMQEDVNELEKLIDEMLCYAEANQIKDFNKENVYVINFINELVDNARPGAINLHTSFSKEITESTQFSIEEHNFFRALSNIIRNALSYAKSECLIQLSQQENFLVIKIMDDGVGISPGDESNIFLPFYKINNEKRAKGYGLGLAIAKSIIEKHKGKITLTSGILKGACFQISIPLSGFE